MIEKINNLFTKTIKAPGIQGAQALVAMCPGSLQTDKMMKTAVIKRLVPLVDEQEWEKYITLPRQLPPPSTTAGRVHWWKQRLAEFPRLAPVAIAYLLSPRSAAQAERTFSLLGHIQTPQRLNMEDTTLRALTFCYVNKELFEVTE